MAFHVYPDPQTAPLNVAAGADSALIPVVTLVSAEVTPTMYLRLVKLGAGCAAPGGPAPTVRLKSGAGDIVVVPTGSTAAIYDGPGGTGQEGAVTMDAAAPGDVFRIRIFMFGNLTGWQIQVHNNDAVARDFTWVVADTDTDSQQPWVHAGASLTYDAPTNRTVSLSTEVQNRGTGNLTINNVAPGPGFTLGAIPGPIAPNSCANLPIQFAAGGAPGQAVVNYDLSTNDTTGQIGGTHNRRVALTATTRQLEVMLLLDLSGSMSWAPGSSSAPPPGQPSRWDHLQDSADQFLDLLGDYGDGIGRFGVARFPNVGGGATAGTIQAATDITVANIAAARAAVNAPGLTPDGGTPMGAGIEHLLGSTSANFGFFRGNVPADAQAVLHNRRYLVLMSDGAHNEDPPDPNKFYEPPPAPHGPGLSLADKKVQAITVAYGDEGVGAADVDHGRLNTIRVESDAPPTHSLDAGVDDAAELRKAFRSAVTTGLALDSAIDPGGTLSAASPERRHEVEVLPYDRQVSFVVDWDVTGPGQVSVSLLTPTCELITPAVANASPHIEFHGHPGYAIYTIRDAYLRNAANPAAPRYGAWTLIVQASGLGGGQFRRYAYEVIVESRLRMGMEFNRIRFYTGDMLDVRAPLTLDGVGVRNASVTLQLIAPGQSAHNWLARTNASAANFQLATVRMRGQDTTAIGIKKLALELDGIVFDAFNAPSTITMLDPQDQGIYSASYGPLAVPGSYDLMVTATGVTTEGVSFRRERRAQVRVEVRPIRQFTDFDISYQPLGLDPRIMVAQVRVTPKDQFGNVLLVNPDLNPDFALTVKGADVPGLLVNNLDGSYSTTLRYPAERPPTVALDYADQKLVPQRRLVRADKLQYVDRVVAFKPGREAAQGANRHANSKHVLGDVVRKGEDVFVSLGAFGSLAVGFKEVFMLPAANDDLTVFVHPDGERHPYLVEALQAGVGQPRWVRLGESSGVTQSFTLKNASAPAVKAIRITDRSGKSRDINLKASATPGVSIRGVGVLKTGPLP